MHDVCYFYVGGLTLFCHFYVGVLPCFCHFSEGEFIGRGSQFVIEKRGGVA